MNRLHARAGSALALALVLTSVAPAVRADDTSSLWFAGTRLILAYPHPNAGDLAVSTRDPGFLRFLSRLGATLAYAPGQSYVIITAADRRTVAFTIGDARFVSGGGTARAPFAPYVEDGETYVPFLATARALYVEPVRTGNEIVLQPQLGALDVQNAGGKTTVTLHGATPLRYTTTQTNGRTSITFTGVGSPLIATRTVNAPGLGEIDVQASGTPKAPATTVTFITPPGAAHAVAPAGAPNDLVVAFTGPGGGSIAAAGPAPGSSRAPATPYATPVSPGYPSPAPLASTNAAVTALVVEPFEDGVSVRVNVSGTVTYDWHHLSGAGDRWYVDLHGAMLAIPPREERPATAAVSSVRVAQLHVAGSPTVRVAMTLAGNKRVDLAGFDGGVMLSVSGEDASRLARSGGGQLADGQLVAASAPEALATDSGWKFTPGATPAPAIAPLAPGTNPRLIVIDPGHGGSDAGAVHNGLFEKNLTFDISQRLRSVLAARGWIVKMTRTRDVDVYAPNAADRAELQARCDVANDAGARMFISVHINSSGSTDPNGTTTYYFKPQDRAFAAAIHRHLISTLGTKDDGVQRENFYVVRHTTMPSILVETAFVSNASDAALMRDPAFLQHVAVGIADGVREYAGSPGATPVSTIDAR